MPTYYTMHMHLHLILHVYLIKKYFDLEIEALKLPLLWSCYLQYTIDNSEKLYQNILFLPLIFI